MFELFYFIHSCFKTKYINKKNNKTFINICNEMIFSIVCKQHTEFTLYTVKILFTQTK